MSRCLELAQLGAGYVAPNPMVGALLVHENTIIGEGYHRQYGGPHAEVNCLNSVSEENRPLIAKSTLYVSLEPCAHFGKTPPCADLIIENNIPKVVIGCRDPFARVNGLGIQKLKDAGIEVIQGVMEQEALELNKFFFCFHKKHRPYIILKWAQTANSFIAKKNYEAISISNEMTNHWVHKMRASTAAIMIGTNTALHDDPSLTTRNWTGNNPVRIVIDKKLKINKSAALFRDSASVIILNELEEKKEGHIIYIKIENEKKLLQQLMRFLFEKNISSLMIEGGSILLQSFIDARLWDEAYCITNEQLHINEGIAAVQLPASKKTDHFRLLTDRIDHYKNI